MKQFDKGTRRTISVLLTAALLTAACVLPDGSAASVQASGNKTPYALHGALQVNGTDLVDSKGAKFRLKGVSTHGIAWYPQYVCEDSFRTLRDKWGVNMIRIAMYTAEDGGYCEGGGDKKKLEALIDKGVRACTALGMYAIIDWHILSDNDPNKHKDEALDFFARMSKKYAKNGNVLYEICNEPNPGNGTVEWSRIKSYAEEVIPKIRANAPKAIIIVGTPTWSQDVDKAADDPISDQTNIMYTLHFYAATHGAALMKKFETAHKKGLPVIISEFSICDASGNGTIDYRSAAKWAELIEKYNLSTAGWSLANKDEAAAFLKPSCTKISGWDDADLTDTGKWQLDFIKGTLKTAD
ncbi:MAG: glycoside hydrolase family 5 protein [Lachnospiraceae bacterium]|jgi:aryl-phospho-beta-D-glucosidase BglC (GH1 family)|nr:glycoside hydrolase family 5 protein [Lachnospiraceae bacterium]